TTLVEVFKQALEAITLCPCNLEAEQDGCYRCVYQYRQGRVMELVSREVLSELVSATDQLERVPTITDIFINPTSTRHWKPVLSRRYGAATQERHLGHLLDGGASRGARRGPGRGPATRRVAAAARLDAGRLRTACRRVQSGWRRAS